MQPQHISGIRTCRGSSETRGGGGGVYTYPGCHQESEGKIHREFLAVVLASDVIIGPVWPAPEHHDRALIRIKLMVRRDWGGGKVPR